MDRFKPDLARTLIPGASLVPAAARDILATFKSSRHTLAWFLLRVVVSLCRESRRAWLIRTWSRCRRASTFFQLRLSCTLRLRTCCALRKAAQAVPLPTLGAGLELEALQAFHGATSRNRSPQPTAAPAALSDPGLKAEACRALGQIHGPNAVGHDKSLTRLSLVGHFGVRPVDRILAHVRGGNAGPAGKQMSLG